MTPAQIEHLKRIDAHLANLLSTAEMRTPGDWAISRDLAAISGYHFVKTSDTSPLATIVTGSEHDAAFIASCAGNAEAGWRATRSLIDYLLMMHKHGDGYRYVGLTEDIIAAFPNI